jgi:hypothetical protein
MYQDGAISQLIMDLRGFFLMYGTMSVLIIVISHVIIFLLMDVIWIQNFGILLSEEVGKIS